jgi:hypothetical protein
MWISTSEAGQARGTVATFGAADAFVAELLSDDPSPATTDYLAKRLALVVDGLSVFRRHPEIEANALFHCKNRSYHNHSVSVWRNLRFASKEICAFRLAIPKGFRYGRMGRACGCGVRWRTSADRAYPPIAPEDPPGAALFASGRAKNEYRNFSTRYLTTLNPDQ